MEPKELYQILSETARLQKKTARRLRYVSKQLAGFSNQFGSYADDMALPSMKKLLRQRFGMTHVALSAKVVKNGEEMELDVFAYANDEINTAIIVEVKSHLRERDVQRDGQDGKIPALFP